MNSAFPVSVTFVATRRCDGHMQPHLHCGMPWFHCPQHTGKKAWTPPPPHAHLAMFPLCHVPLNHSSSPYSTKCTMDTLFPLHSSHTPLAHRQACMHTTTIYLHTPPAAFTYHLLLAHLTMPPRRGWHRADCARPTPHRQRTFHLNRSFVNSCPAVPARATDAQAPALRACCTT